MNADEFRDRPGEPGPGAQQGTQYFEVAAEEMEVCLRVKGASGRYELTHRLRPPTSEDWRAYERDLRSTVEVAESEPDALRFSAATLEAAGSLYDRLFRGATGYRAGDATGTISAEQIPLHHKEMAVRALTDVGPSTQCEVESCTTGPRTVGDESAEPQLFSVDTGGVAVVLEATRNGVSYGNLVHTFRAPMAADRVEFSRVTSQALYVRNSHTLKTILPSRLPGLVALYDRLIEEVRGYAAAGAPLTDRAAAVRQMDPLHKKVAVQLLFGE